MVTIDEVKNYWQENPLYSFEIKELGSQKFFDEVDRIKREDVEAFSLDFWEFEKFKNKKILDIGCGNGWLTVNYSLQGGNVYAIDLTNRAVELTKGHLEYKKASANVREGNAEGLDFENNYFDLIISSGVLHHIPNTYQAFKECYRVLKPGGKAKVSLYHKGILNNKFLFTFSKLLMKLFEVKHPGANLTEAKDVSDFIRRYDGNQNPFGIGKSTKEWICFLNNTGFLVKKHELHYFPKRFIPINKYLPKFTHSFLDKYFGTMIYFELAKP